MLEVIKPLLDSDLVNEQTRNEIQEAWDNKLNEVREEVRAELREEFAGRYEHDKQTMVEALDKMVTENLQAELGQVVAEKKQLAEDRVKYNAKMSEAVVAAFTLTTCKGIKDPAATPFKTTVSVLALEPSLFCHF